MTDPLQVTPADLRTTSAQLADVSSQMKTVLSSLQSKLSGLGQPWGADSTGNSFAQGSGGYLAQQDWVNSSITAKTQLLDEYSGQLTDTADSMQQQDEN